MNPSSQIRVKREEAALLQEGEVLHQVVGVEAEVLQPRAWEVEVAVVVVRHLEEEEEVVGAVVHRSYLDRVVVEVAGVVVLQVYQVVVGEVVEEAEHHLVSVLLPELYSLPDSPDTQQHGMLLSVRNLPKA